MKQSLMFIPTLREVPADADIKSHQLLLRAGYIRQNTSGIYSYLPLAQKVLQNIQDIVRDEMNKAGASELLMPAMQQSELWQESGRWYSYGPELMRLKDRHGREFALGATHEEVITSLVRDEVKSYKRLPLALYQIQSKFRDEKRPRFGILRGREFIMKDAYSFHSSYESLDEMYDKMFTAYSNIFERCGLNFRAVIADSGAMGGKDTHEFMVLSEVGEDTIAYSDQSSFAANVEMAPVTAEYTRSDETCGELEKKETPSQKTIEEVAEFFEVAKEKCIKSLLFKADDRLVLVLSRGDHEINDIKVKNLFDARNVELATPEETKEALNCPIGFIGPIGVPEGIEVVADAAVKAIVNGVCGANEEGFHYISVDAERDLKVGQYADLRFIQEGDASPDGKGTIQFARGIEVGHIFKLGTRYSVDMNASYLDENGRSQPMIMGCYGIGVSRTLAAIVEQFNDENGIVWPEQIAPFDLHVVPANMKSDAQVALAEKVYADLGKTYSILFDDRAERAGVKFADSDLIGLPIRITAGKRAEENIVELKVRKTGEKLDVPVDELAETISRLLGK
ncbi:proline--tRNA ligase [Metabacillus sp. KIGAM252]|uniref:Proline--tRNA ligase n=1 Tax=Metabacillus flavus TaxID=2823519 RepID=A0ABS5LES3_9BACI|nr:proline--tRNA ligase [Metabacillus flavus]MBS2969018.1 proline--tRNA ligase [Metabacillus flavus]